MGWFLPLVFGSAAGGGGYMYRDKLGAAWHGLWYSDKDGDGVEERDIKGAFKKAAEGIKTGWGVTKKGFSVLGEGLDGLRSGIDVFTGDGNDSKNDKGGGSPSTSSGDDGGLWDSISSAFSGISKNTSGLNWGGTLLGAGAAGVLSLISKKFFGTGFTGPFLFMALSAFTYMNFGNIKEFALDFVDGDSSKPRADTTGEVTPNTDPEYSEALDFG